MAQDLAPYQLLHQLGAAPTPHRLNVLDLTASYQLLDDHSGALITNKGASGTIVVSLPNRPRPGWYALFCVQAAQVLSIDPPSDGAITLAGTKDTDGDAISANDEGESLMLVYQGDNDYVAMFVVGTWTAA